MPDAILIVEDEPKMGRIIQDYFAAHGVEADWVPDGSAALERTSARDYDAVLLDVMMPGLDGYSVCRALRQESSLPILFLTALGGEEHALRGYALGADLSLWPCSTPRPPRSSGEAAGQRTAPFPAGPSGWIPGEKHVQPVIFPSPYPQGNMICSSVC